ncbi:MAG: imidazole glycerol phosphate synthase subunit HisH [Bacillus sp. (in: firmicutes)]
MIGIVDYGMGNLFSVSKALERLGEEYLISDQVDELCTVNALILPGVGSFKDAMDLLWEKGLVEFLLKYAAGGRPILGICLGMQLLFEQSEENGLSRGLTLLPGHIVRFSGLSEAGETYKVPHMGWNGLEYIRKDPITAECEPGHVYFVHSYRLQSVDPAVCIATADYHGKVPAIVGKGNIYGMQFHPEKSGDLGMSLLRNYVKLAEKRVER